MRGVVLVAVLCLALLPGDGAREIRSNLPPMTGIASAPVTVDAGTPFSYTITGEDRDTYGAASDGIETLQTLPDHNLKLVCVRMRSMRKGWTVTKRGTSGATTTWEVRGVAVGTPKSTYKHDDWRVENPATKRGDPRSDKPMTMTQTVLINVPAKGEPKQ